VVTLSHGPFEAREVHKWCKDTSCPVVRSDALAHLVKPRQRYGYDLIVAVGLARYLQGKQRQEIRAWLSNERHIELSEGTISHLCDRFLTYLEALHLVRSPHLRAVLQKEGYPLHLDATCDNGKGGLFVCMAGWRGWVLGADKIPSEHEDHLRPLVDKTVALFGDPIAIVRDLGGGMAGAVAYLRLRGIPDLACHYHFLRVIGKKLFDTPYAALRGHLKRHKVASGLNEINRKLRRYRNAHHANATQVREDLLALVHWLLQGDGTKDLAYPFSLPHLELFHRCCQAKQRAAQWVPKPRTRAEDNVFRQIGLLLSRVIKPDTPSAIAARKLGANWWAFCELRDVLRLTDADLPGGDSRTRQAELPALQAEHQKEIAQASQSYLADLRQRVRRQGRSAKPRTAEAIILEYFEKYGDHLFGHPVRRDQDGSIIAVVDRTNNELEHLFGKEKQRLRRRLGRAHLGRDLDDQPAQVALTANLRHSDYVRIICGSLDNLPVAFASLDQQALQNATPLCRSNRDTVIQARVRVLIESIGEIPTRDLRSTPNGAIPTVV
jgi:hypothetical protein